MKFYQIIGLGQILSEATFFISEWNQICLVLLVTRMSKPGCFINQ